MIKVHKGRVSRTHRPLACKVKHHEMGTTKKRGEDVARRHPDHAKWGSEAHRQKLRRAAKRRGGRKARRR